MSLTKIAIVALAVALLMPTPPETEQASGSAPTASLQTFELVSAASNTLSDVSGFCGRQPGVCETAGYVLHKLEAKAKYGVRLLYEWANDANGSSVPPSQSNETVADPLTTGSTSLAFGEQSPGTLTIEDLIPEWRGPGAVKGG